MVLPQPSNAREGCRRPLPRVLVGPRLYHSLAWASALCDMSVVPGARLVVFRDDSPGLYQSSSATFCIFILSDLVGAIIT